MLKSRAIDILKTLTPGELKRFRDFVRSPFHNKNSNVIMLFELFKLYYPEFTNEGLEKERLFKKLYPGKKYSDTVMRILLSDLSKLGEEFLAILNFQSNDYVQRRHLLKELQLRRIDNIFSKVLKETEDIVSDKELGKEYGFYYRHDLESIKNNFYLARNKQELTNSIISKKGENIICYALIDLFIISESMLSNKNAYNITIDTNLTNEFLGSLDLDGLVEYIKTSLPEYYPAVGIFYYLYKTINNPEDELYFNQAKDLFRTYLNEFNRNEQFLLYAKIQNVCKEKSRGGNDNFTSELLGIYKERIEKKLLVLPRRKYLNIWDYRDIMITALELKEIDWAGEFVEAHSHELDPEQYDSGFNYGMAIVNFGKGKYEAALENISNVKYDFFLFKIDLKNLTAKIYYELEYYNQAVEMIDSYRHFLSKNKTVSEPFRKYNMNFIRLYLELLKAKERKGKGLDELTLNFSNQSHIRNKSWIAEKINELSSAFS
jgi:hypothetical protein